MSDRYSASTPPSSSRSGAVSSSSTGKSSRHLKRLSLSGSAFSPVGSPVESTGTTTTTGAASPLSSRTARPASALVGGSPAAGGGALADRTNSPSLLRRSTSYRAASAASPASSAPSSTAAAGATPEHPPQATSNADRSLPTPTRSGSAARVRRGTSISYTGGSTPTRLSLDGGGALREETPSRASLDSPATRTSSALGLADVPETENTLVVPQIESRAHTFPGPSSTQPSPALSATSGSTTSAATSSAAAPTPSTLLEQNADLLSIIAKKERKCLDLREELKRNEADLAALKNKWQAIVARSLQAQAYQPYIPFQHRSSPSIATTASTASPNTSPTPQPALLPHAAHSLDLSLLSSTFEPADYNLDGITPSGHVHGDASPMEIPESVKAAGNWLGGALGRVLEAAVGMPPPLEEEEADDEAGDEYEQPLRRRDVTGLGIVNEEQEEDDPEPERPRVGTATMNGGLASPAPEPLSSPRDAHPSLSPPPSSSSRATRSARSPLPPASSSSPTSTSSSSYGLSSPGTSPTHSRTRSAFSGLLSDKLSSRWAALSSSEMIQSSKRATLGLVDTFEQGLAHALGPLEPPPLPPFEQQQHQQRSRADEADRTRTEEEQQQQQQRNAQARRLPMPGATPGQGLASLFAAASSTSPRPADHFAD